MFSNSRPVPSKAALKLLYQLAYISSGTAVGVATLCAEERRRRTLLVQKIADNAKRIRQSPRYVHTIARRRVDDVEDPSVYPVRRRRPAESDAVASIDIGDRAARGPELPSVVDTGYAQLQQPASSASEDGNSIGPRRAATSDNAQSAVQVTPRKTQNSKRRTKLRKVDSILDRNPTPTPRASECVARFTPLAPSTIQQIVAKVPQPRAALPESKNRPQARSRLPLFVTVAEMRQRPIGSKLPLTAAFSVRREDVMHDVALFMRFKPHIDDATHSYCKAVAVWLLHLSAREGLLAEVRSLIPWLRAHNALSPDLILAICESCYNLVVRSDVNVAEICTFYNRLLAMPEFVRQDLHAQFRARFAVVVDLVRPAIVDHKVDLSKSLLLIDRGQVDLVVQALKQHYDTLHAQGSVEHAKNLLVAVCTWGSYGLLCNGEIPSLVRHCIDWALAKGSLGPAMSLWRLKSWTPLEDCDEPETHLSDLVSLLDSIARLATRCQSIAQLQIICQTMARARAKDRPWYTSVLGRINLDTKTSLAIAYNYMGKLKPDLLRDLRHGMPPHLLRKVDGVRAAAPLKRVWADTRSLPAVFARYDLLKSSEERLNLEPDQVGHIGPAEIALIEVCNLAQQSNRAVQIFKAGYKRHLQSTDSFSLAALTLAHKQDWRTIGTLLKTAHKSHLSVGHDEMATRRLNVVAWLHTHRHSASQTWAFITSLVDSVDFKLNAATAKMMTKHLVSRSSVGQPTLLPAWMRFVRNQGVEFAVDSALAVAMMRHFYLAKRVPHVILMQLCRKLLMDAPQLRGPGWRHLIKQAIGYDLRVLDTRHSHEMREAGAQNLRNVSKSEDIVPVPIRTMSLRRHASVPVSSRIAVAGRPRIDEVDPGITPEYSYNTRDDVALSTPGAEPDLRAIKRTLPPSTSAASARMGNMPDKLDHTANEYYNKIVGGFYARDADEADSATVVHSNADHRDEVLPTEVDHFGRFVHHEDKADMDFDEDNDDAMLVDAMAAQQAVGPSGLDSTKDAQKQVAKMIWNLSVKRYREVLELYESSLSPTGLPVAPLALAVVVQARIRLDCGDVQGATDIIDAARNAGFNVIVGMAPILIRNMRILRVKDKQDANQLRVQVLEYYRAMSEAGFPVSHHVGVSAANVLIDNGWPELGLNLLDSIYRPKWSEQNPVNIVAMAVYLKGYTALRSLRGIMWVVVRVMKSNMRIDRRFLYRLHRAPKAFDRYSQRSNRGRRTVDRRLLATLQHARALCAQRRMVQRQESKQLGAKLVRAIGLTVLVQQASNDTEMRLAIERGYFGRATSLDRHGQVSWTDSTGTGALAARYCPRSYLFRRRSAQQMQFTGTKVPRLGWIKPRNLTQGAAYHRLRLTQYRVFRKERCVIANGQSMSFRDYLATKAGKMHSARALSRPGGRWQQQSRLHRKERTKQATDVPVQSSIARSRGEPHWLRPLQKVKAGEKQALGRNVILSPWLKNGADIPIELGDPSPSSRGQPKEGLGHRKSSRE